MSRDSVELELPLANDAFWETCPVPSPSLPDLSLLRPHSRVTIFFLIVHGKEASDSKLLIWNDPDAWKKTRIRIIRTIVIVEWLIWSTVVRYTLMMFNCRPYGDDDSEQRLVYDLEVKCYSEFWWTTAFWRLFVPSFLLHILLFPGFMMYVLWANSSHFADKEGTSVEISTFYSTYGFLVAGYRRDSWITISWELTVLLRRMIVSCCFVFLWDMPQTQIATVFLVLLIAAYMHLCEFGGREGERESARKGVLR